MPIGNLAIGLSVAGTRSLNPSWRGNKTFIIKQIIRAHAALPQGIEPLFARCPADSTGQAMPSRCRDGAGGLAWGE